MKQKINKRSLIFPIICAVGAPILLLIRSEVALSSEESVMLAVFAVCAVLPLPSVLFLKTDISRLLKWQIIYTASAGGTFLLYFLTILALLLGPALLIGITASVGIAIACPVTFAVLLKRENSGRKALKWVTALLSTPGMYLCVWLAYVLIRFCSVGLSGLSTIG